MDQKLLLKEIDDTYKDIDSGLYRYHNEKESEKIIDDFIEDLFSKP